MRQVDVDLGERRDRGSAEGNMGAVEGHAGVLRGRLPQGWGEEARALGEEVRRLSHGWDGAWWRTRGEGARPTVGGKGRIGKGWEEGEDVGARGIGKEKGWCLVGDWWPGMANRIFPDCGKGVSPIPSRTSASGRSPRLSGRGTTQRWKGAT